MPTPPVPRIIHFAALIAAANSAGSAAAAAAAVFQLLSVRLVPEAVAAAEGAGMFRLATLLSQVRTVHCTALVLVGSRLLFAGRGLLEWSGGNAILYPLLILPMPPYYSLSGSGGRWATTPTSCT